MRFIDSHTHAYLRGAEDLELMSLAGVEGLVLCSYFPVMPSGPSTLIDLYKWLIRDEGTRLAKYGMKSWSAIGIHPRSIPEKGVDEVLAHMRVLFSGGKASALGEVGLETGSAEEVEVLTKQLRLADELNKPAIVHTPRADKLRMLEKTLAILNEVGMPLHGVILDHLTPDLVPMVRSAGALAGLTVQPGKLTARDVGDILLKNGPDGIVVNSDLGNVPSDPLTLPKVGRYLVSAGIDTNAVEMATYSNIRNLLTQ